jgi:hypothetical protein
MPFTAAELTILTGGAFLGYIALNILLGIVFICAAFLRYLNKACCQPDLNPELMEMA